jgi:hypothetical protein
VLIYADDSQIFSCAKDCVELNANLNHDLNNVSQWLVKNKLQHHSTISGSADVLRTLVWENLETRWYLTKATFLYKVLSNSAAPILKDAFISINILLNNYNFRNSQTDLTLPKPNRESLKRSFKYSGAYLWNNLPLEAKQA